MISRPLQAYRTSGTQTAAAILVTLPGGFLMKVDLPDGKELSFSLTPAEQ